MNTLTFETGLSDYHKLIGTMLRSTFSKAISKKICYKNLCINTVTRTFIMKS